MSLCAPPCCVKVHDCAQFVSLRFPLSHGLARLIAIFHHFTPSLRYSVPTNAAAPPPLIELIGLESMLQCVPEAYLRAMFSAKLASDFVYEHGLNPPGAAFIDFLVESISALPVAAAAAKSANAPLPTAPLAEVSAANPAS